MIESTLLVLEQFNLEPGDVLRFALFFAGGILLSLIVAVAVFVWVPGDFLLWNGKPRPSRAVWKRVLKNTLGIALIVIGFVTAIPLVPAPGFLFLVLGLLLIDFPWKRPLEKKILTRPGVFRRLNRLRARFGREPLVIPA